MTLNSQFKAVLDDFATLNNLDSGNLPEFTTLGQMLQIERENDDEGIESKLFKKLSGMSTRAVVFADSDSCVDYTLDDDEERFEYIESIAPKTEYKYTTDDGYDAYLYYGVGEYKGYKVGWYAIEDWPDILVYLIDPVRA